MRIVIIGATGLVGSALTERLSAGNKNEVHALLRRPSGHAHPCLREYVVPADRWPDVVGEIGAEAAVSALGTTMRAAGSEAAFRAVDFDMVVDFARAAHAAGARRMTTISSVGADPRSHNFYLRLKGEAEASLDALAFERLDIFRPGLLRGPRGGERRVGERIGIMLNPVLNLALRGPLDRFAAIDGDVVAAAVAASLRQEEPGVFRHDNRAIRRLARS